MEHFIIFAEEGQSCLHVHIGALTSFGSQWERGGSSSSASGLPRGSWWTAMENRMWGLSGLQHDAAGLVLYSKVSKNTLKLKRENV